MADTTRNNWLMGIGVALLWVAFLLSLLVLTAEVPPSAGIETYWPWWLIELGLAGMGVIFFYRGWHG